MRAASLALIATLAASAAAAQQPPIVTPADPLTALDITGLWRVATAHYAGTCRAEGVMDITAANGAGAGQATGSEQGPEQGPAPLSATLTLHWACRDVELGSGRQDCVVMREAAAVAISCSVVSVSPPDIAYVHDDFSLTIASPAHMTGLLLTAEPRDLPVTFTRRMSATS